MRTHDKRRFFFSAGFVRLKAGSSPILDGQGHLVPFCETLEAIFRHGLKRKLQRTTLLPPVGHGVICAARLIVVIEFATRPGLVGENPCMYKVKTYPNHLGRQKIKRTKSQPQLSRSWPPED